MEKKSDIRPVAVFDSGVGGISVLKELYRLLPHENFHFFGDSLHAPYGTKDIEEVRRLTIGHIDRMIEQGAKAVVIACNTATSAATRTLRQKYPDIPIVGMEPALKPAALSKKGARVLVLATPMTLNLDKFRVLMEQYKDQAEVLLKPCPGLAELIEQGDPQSERIKSYLRETLMAYIEEPVDAVVLGCTHYPFIKPAIREVLGRQITFFDGANGTARQLKHLLEETGRLNLQAEPGEIVFESSLEEALKSGLYQRMYEMEIAGE